MHALYVEGRTETVTPETTCSTSHENFVPG